MKNVNKAEADALKELSEKIANQVEEALRMVVLKAIKEKDLGILRKFMGVMEFISNCHNGTDHYSAVLILCENGHKGSVISLAGVNISEEEAEATVQMVGEGIASSKSIMNPQMMN